MSKICIGIFRSLCLFIRSIGRTFCTQIRWAGIDIGYNSSVGRGCLLAGENKIGQNCIVSDSVVGKASYCANNTVISNAEIGAYTSIGSNVSIGLHAHPTRGYISTFPGFHFKWDTTPYLDKPKLFDVQKRTNVGNDVWIGNSAIILNGVSIGDGAIVGAGAVVTHDVPPYAIVGGVPAKILRFRFSKSQISALLKTCWWKWSSEEIARHQSFFSDIDAFFSEIENA